MADSPEPIPHDPGSAIRKLLLSARNALPLVGDPWDALAFGVKISREELADALAGLQADGFVQGVWLEPNPALAPARSAWRFDGEIAAGETVRWRSGRVSAVMALGRDCPGDFVATRYVKIGQPLAVDDSMLLRPGADRTYRNAIEGAVVPALAEEEARLADLLFAPQRVDASRPLWEQIGERAGLAGSAAASIIRRLVPAGVARRFALAVAPEALGFSGGLALWRIGDGAERAAQSLAEIAGTGDVALLEPAPGGPDVLALFLAREPGAAENAARTIARQWGRDVDWRPLGG